MSLRDPAPASRRTTAQLVASRPIARPQGKVYFVQTPRTRNSVPFAPVQIVDALLVSALGHLHVTHEVLRHAGA